MLLKNYSLIKKMLTDNSSLSSSDDDIEIVAYLTRRRKKTNIRHQILWTDVEFRSRFRLSKIVVEQVHQYIKPKLQIRSKRNNALSSWEQLLIALRFYATCSIQQVLGDIGPCDRTTVGRAIHNISKAIASLAPSIIFMPQTETECREIANDFYRIAQFPRVIGAIDCTHIPIQSPGGERAELYRNRKGWFSINVQTVVDANLLIRDIVCRWPGSSHDATIFENSVIKSKLDDREFGDYYVLGDRGYPQLSYLMVPLADPQTPGAIAYNNTHIKTRNTVERCYGVWKRRFPCTGLKLRVKIQNMEAIIVATAVLHNICRLQNEPHFDDNPDEFIDCNEMNETITTATGNSERNDLITRYFDRLI